MTIAESASNEAASSRLSTADNPPTSKPDTKRVDDQQQTPSQKRARVDNSVTQSNTTFDSLSSPQQSEKKASQGGRCRLFIGNVPSDLTQDEFQLLFGKYGELVEYFVNPSRGFGFIKLVCFRHDHPACTLARLLELSSVGRTGEVRPRRVHSARQTIAHSIRQPGCHGESEEPVAERVQRITQGGFRAILWPHRARGGHRRRPGQIHGRRNHRIRKETVGTEVSERMHRTMLLRHEVVPLER